MVSSPGAGYMSNMANIVPTSKVRTRVVVSNYKVDPPTIVKSGSAYTVDPRSLMSRPRTYRTYMAKRVRKKRGPSIVGIVVNPDNNAPATAGTPGE